MISEWCPMLLLRLNHHSKDSRVTPVKQDISIIYSNFWKLRKECSSRHWNAPHATVWPLGKPWAGPLVRPCGSVAMITWHTFCLKSTPFCSGNWWLVGSSRPCIRTFDRTPPMDTLQTKDWPLFGYIIPISEIGSRVSKYPPNQQSNVRGVT